MYSFTWTEECHQAFEEPKKFLESPPLLSKPKVGEELYLYLTTSPEAISSILVWVDNKGVQKSMNYTSQVLHDVETRYSKAEKIVYAPIISVLHLRPYFQVHNYSVD